MLFLCIFLCYTMYEVINMKNKQYTVINKKLALQYLKEPGVALVATQIISNDIHYVEVKKQSLIRLISLFEDNVQIGYRNLDGYMIFEWSY